MTNNKGSNQDRIDEILLAVEMYGYLDAEKLDYTMSPAQAKTELLKWINECIGEDEVSDSTIEYEEKSIPKQSDDGWKSKDILSSEGKSRNQLRAELRKKIGLD